MRSSTLITTFGIAALFAACGGDVSGRGTPSGLTGDGSGGGSSENGAGGAAQEGTPDGSVPPWLGAGGSPRGSGGAPTADGGPGCVIDPETGAVVLLPGELCALSSFIDCSATMESLLAGYECGGGPAGDVTRHVGCGVVTLSRSTGYITVSYHFDAETGRRLGIDYYTDVATGPCDPAKFRTGADRPDCDVLTSSICLRTDAAPQPWPDSGGGGGGAQSVTACAGTGQDAPCLAPGAVCRDEPGKVAPCTDLFDPICACPEGECACWGHFGMDGPPYPGTPATACDSTEDTTTCSAPGAQCWSIHADLADDCAAFTGPVCDCDDSPCRCWAPERSRIIAADAR